MAKAGNTNEDQSSRIAQARTELSRRMTAQIETDGRKTTAIPGLTLYRHSAPTACASATYEPSFIFFVQGRKRINFGKTVLVCDNSNFLLTSVDLPVVSQVIDATPRTPILGLILQLEMPEVRKILSEEEFAVAEESTDACGMAVGAITAELLSACSRLMDLLDAPQDILF